MATQRACWPISSCFASWKWASSLKVVIQVNLVPSLLWHCWLGGKNGIQPVLSREVLAWVSVWGEVQTYIWPSWYHCHPLSLASVKSRLVFIFLVPVHRGSPGQTAIKWVLLFPGEPGLASSPSQFSSSTCSRREPLGTSHTKVCTAWTPFPSPNQLCETTERNSKHWPQSRNLKLSGCI